MGTMLQRGNSAEILPRMPQSCAPLLGRVLPMQLSGDSGGPVQTQQIAPEGESPRDTLMRRINALAARNSERSSDERSVHDRVN